MSIINWKTLHFSVSNQIKSSEFQQDGDKLKFIVKDASKSTKVMFEQYSRGFSCNNVEIELDSSGLEIMTKLFQSIGRYYFHRIESFTMNLRKSVLFQITEEQINVLLSYQYKSLLINCKEELNKEEYIHFDRCCVILHKGFHINLLNRRFSPYFLTYEMKIVMKNVQFVINGANKLRNITPFCAVRDMPNFLERVTVINLEHSFILNCKILETSLKPNAKQIVFSERLDHLSFILGLKNTLRVNVEVPGTDLILATFLRVLNACCLKKGGNFSYTFINGLGLTSKNHKVYLTSRYRCQKKVTASGLGYSNRDDFYSFLKYLDRK